MLSAGDWLESDSVCFFENPVCFFENIVCFFENEKPPLNKPPYIETSNTSRLPARVRELRDVHQTPIPSGRVESGFSLYSIHEPAQHKILI